MLNLVFSEVSQNLKKYIHCHTGISEIIKLVKLFAKCIRALLVRARHAEPFFVKNGLKIFQICCKKKSDSRIKM